MATNRTEDETEMNQSKMSEEDTAMSDSPKATHKNVASIDTDFDMTDVEER